MTGNPTRGRLKLLSPFVAAALVITACGGSDGDGGEASEDTVASTAGANEDGEAASDDGDTEVVASETTGDYGGTLIIGNEAEIGGTRPWETTSGTSLHQILLSVYDPLVEVRSDGTVGPWLATSITPNEDFTVWTLELRDDVTFHSGDAFSAQTLVDMFPIQQEGAQASGFISAAGITDVEATGEYEVVYTLGSPNSAFPATLTDEPAFVFNPASAADETATDGTGPFVLESWDVDNEMVLVRNENYWATDRDGNQLPYLDSIVFRPIPDEGSRLDSLLSGTTNVLVTARQGTIRDAREKADGYNLYEHQGNNVGAGFFNAARPPYDDVRVRRGLVLTTNQDALIEALGGTGISLPGTQWFSPDSVWYSEAAADAYLDFDFEAGTAELQSYVDDPERSDGKAVGEPIDVDFACPPDPALLTYFQVLEQLWTQTGLVNVSATNFDQATHIANALGAAPDFIGDFGAHCWRVGRDDDPSLEINRYMAPYNSENAVENGLPETLFSPANFPNYFSLESFEKLQAAIATDDFDERYALYEDVMVDLNENAVWWYAAYTATLVMTDDDVMGLNSWELQDGTLGIGHPSAYVRWRSVWIEQ